MKRFWETLDVQLLWFAGVLVLWAISVGATGTYPQGRFARPAKVGDHIDVIILVSGALILVGLAFFVRAIINKMTPKTKHMKNSAKNPNSY